MVSGGARKGAGRPKNKEPTKAVRLPLSVIGLLEKFNHSFKLPLYASKVSAGFPSPADDYISEHLDLNDYLIARPAATFFVRASGNSMIEAGIYENDILIVDRSISPTSGKIVIAALDGMLTVKRLAKKSDGKFQLLPANPEYPPIDIPENSSSYIWGVVTYIIHAAK